MTIQEVVAMLKKEKQTSVPSRFPCRVIMVRNIQQYCDLLSELRKLNDVQFVPTQELFSNIDVMPKYENLKNECYRKKWVVLTGVSEYLRLFFKSEQTDRRFAGLWSYQAPASSIGRIIIPLWGCESQWFDKSLNLSADLRQQDFYYDCTDSCSVDQKMNLIVLSGKFENYIEKLEAMQGELKIGLQDWFEYWLDPVPEKKDFVLLTKRFRNVSPTNGDISIRVISDTLAFIHENMKGSSVLTNNNCTDEMQKILFEYALKGNDLNSAILQILNMSSFSGQDIMGKWKVLDETHKSFVDLWFKLYPDNTYLSHCFTLIDNNSGLTNILLHEIFKKWVDKPDWVKEYRALLQVMKITPDEKFFEELDSIPIFEKRLDFIVGNSRNEQIYLLRMVGKWIRLDYQQAISSEKLKSIYPDLVAYMADESLSVDNEIKDYMIRYKSFKLENTLPEDEETFFNGVQTDVYDMRYTILSEYINNNTVVLWIDALGIEWFSLLHWSLKNHCDALIQAESIVQASLPTETEFNDQWVRMTNPYKKLDKLDKLAHKGVIDEPDYYACIQEQLAFVTGIKNIVNELMETYNRVIVTGDHGTSRLAARFFHKRDAMPLPKNSTACSHGRYCLLDSVVDTSIPNTQIATVNGAKYAVFKNYDHFTQSGFAAGANDDNAIYGEVHGGASPEEMLVPIIVLDCNRDIPLIGKWRKETVKISMKKVKLFIDFNKPVEELQIRIAGKDGETISSSDPKSWIATFKGIEPDTYFVQVYADGRILTMPDITVKPALGGGEGDLPI